MIYDKNLLTNAQGSSDLIAKRVYSEKVLTLEDIARVNQRFMGSGMSQNYLAIPWFEAYFDAHQFEYIVEFGSQKACLSTYFANFAGITERVFFDTFELFPDDGWSSRSNEGAGHWFEKLAELSPYINYYHQDVFSDETVSHVSENIKQSKTFIFCDGGDKAHEFNTYAPLLKSGDCIAVHDWGHEIHQNQIQETMDKYGLEIDTNFSISATQFHTLIMPFRKL
tara:strand:- start:18 stop:689 length:672 start_codon:yes stop_codon:yes gene_type:complete